MIKLLPLEKLLLETDSPALSFEPGKMNQPKNLRISAEIIAKIKKVDVDTVIKQTTLNAFKLFPRNGFIHSSAQGSTDRQKKRSQVFKFLMVQVRSDSKFQIFDGPGPVLDF